jgi:hypothetical protein
VEGDTAALRHISGGRLCFRFGGSEILPRVDTRCVLLMQNTLTNEAGRPGEWKDSRRKIVEWKMIAT